MSRPLRVFSGDDPELDRFAEAVREGLSRKPQKTLESRYLYDPIGSALFEVITLLQEYGVTRADERLIERHAAELADRMDSKVTVAELGSGTGSKTRQILSALARKGPVHYLPIDVSGSALERCSQDLQQLDDVTVEPLRFSYVDGLRKAMETVPMDRQLLLLFLGGTIGNFERHAIPRFFRQLRAILRPGDAFLIGTDLEKPVADLLAAYDDPIGVTSAFNLNILARINRDLDGDFDLAQFEHLARYDSTHRRIEMHIRARSDQKARIPAVGLEVHLHRGETIWTESCHKFNLAEIVELAETGGFSCACQWVDREWPFAESLLLAD